MTDNNFKIIIDHRERNTELIESLTLNNIEMEFTTVQVGDYVISERVCIERKTVTDFENSIMNGRLFDQLKRLKDNYEFPVLVIEGDNDDFRLKSNVINGTIASLFIDFGVAIIHTFGPRQTADLIAKIAKHEQDKTQREPTLKGGARAYTHEQFQEYMIGNLPGIGPKLAKSLLRHFKNIRNIANAEQKELMEVEKIGGKKAKLIHKTFNELYNADIPD